jgi:hypothetical protein
MDHVAIFPVTDPSRSWNGSEYVGIYSTIEKADGGGLAVFKPGKNKGVTLKTWLKS